MILPARTTSERPRQAVILAGGRGTRLWPLTKDRPKAMVEFHGKPFLEYVVELLRDQGFERILLLLGYLPDVFKEHFGDGDPWGVKVAYSVTAPDDLTVHRMRVAEALLEERFLLLYCDNYWPLQMDRLWRRYRDANVPALVTVYSNKDGYSRDSVIIDENGLISVFDRSRTTPGLSGVEISYAILERAAVSELLTPDDALFEEAVYPRLAERGKLAAYVTDHCYYSVGSIPRLPLTETFFARHPTVILDRDGVLNIRPPKAHYVRKPSEFHWLPGAKEALAMLREAGYRVIVVSNQAGVARGAMTARDVDAVNDRMRHDAADAGGQIDAVYYCPHDWDEGCECRKPRPGMLFAAQRDFQLDLTRTLFIGDDDRDAQAADAAGAPSALVTEENSLLDIASGLVRGASSPSALVPAET